MKNSLLLVIQMVCFMSCSEAKKNDEVCQQSQDCVLLENSQDPVQKKINASIDCLKKELACKLWRLKKELGTQVSYQGGYYPPLPPANPIVKTDDKTIDKNSFKGSNGTLSNPLVINTPGFYTLSENIAFEPETKGVPAISIQADNVTLDLNGNTLSQSKAGSFKQVIQKTRTRDKRYLKQNKADSVEASRSVAADAVQQCIGIVVESGRKNVTIIGSQGSIEGFSQLGIQVKGGTEDIRIGDSSLLTIKNCGGLATVPFSHTDGTRFYEGGIQIGESYFLANQKFPAPLGLVKGLRITNVQSISNTLGMWLGNTSDGLIKDSSFSSNHDTREFPERIYGIDLDVFSAGVVVLLDKEKGDAGLENLVFEGCRFNSNDASTDKFLMWIGSRGLLLKSAHKNLTLRKCYFNTNTSTGLHTSTADTCGCMLAGGEGTLIEDCEFSGNSAGKIAMGLHQGSVLYSAKDEYTITPCSSLTLRNCVASNNLATGSMGLATGGLRQSYGFLLDSVDGGTCLNCIAQNNRALVDVDPGNTSGRAVGLLFACKSNKSGVLHKLKNITVSGFHASGNRTNCFAKGDCMSAGIYFPYALGIGTVSIQDSTITDNGSTYPGLGYREEVGICLMGFVAAQKDTSFITIERSTISNHRSYGIHSSNFAQVTVLNNTITQNGTGVFLEKSPLCTVVHNTFLYNGQIAVQDTDTQSSSLIAQNHTFNTVNNNYRVSYLAPLGKIPVRQGSFSTSFPQDAQVYDNIEVQQPAVTVATEAEKPAYEFEKDDYTNTVVQLYGEDQVFHESTPTKTEIKKEDGVDVHVNSELSDKGKTSDEPVVSPTEGPRENTSQQDTAQEVPEDGPSETESEQESLTTEKSQDTPSKEKEGFFSGIWKSIKNTFCSFFCS